MATRSWSVTQEVGNNIIVGIASALHLLAGRGRDCSTDFGIQENFSERDRSGGTQQGLQQEPGVSRHLSEIHRNPLKACAAPHRLRLWQPSCFWGSVNPSPFKLSLKDLPGCTHERVNSLRHDSVTHKHSSYKDCKILPPWLSLFRLCLLQLSTTTQCHIKFLQCVTLKAGLIPRLWNLTLKHVCCAALCKQQNNRAAPIIFLSRSLSCLLNAICCFWISWLWVIHKLCCQNVMSRKYRHTDMYTSLSLHPLLTAAFVMLISYRTMRHNQGTTVPPWTSHVRRAFQVYFTESTLLTTRQSWSLALLILLYCFWKKRLDVDPEACWLPDPHPPLC